MPTTAWHRLLNHMEWADAQTWDALLAETQAQTDANLRELLYHIHGVHWVYLQIWRGETRDIPGPAAFPDLPALHTWCKEYYQQLEPFLSGLESEAMDEEIAFPWTERLEKRFGAARPVTLGETILQVTSHTTYHRGQLNRRLRELGGEPKPTDFVAWVWMGSPKAEWKATPTTDGQTP